MITDLREFWTEAHCARNSRWLACSDPMEVIDRFRINLDNVESVLEIGPGLMWLPNHLLRLGKRVFVHDIVDIDDPRYVASLPLSEPVDLAIAHLVLQHVPTENQRDLVTRVTQSLASGGKFYFDAVTIDCRDNPDLAQEFHDGISFPFMAWDLVTSKREVRPGYFFCIVEAA